MIIEYLVSVATSVVGWFSSLLPQVDVPEWFSGLGEAIDSLLTHTEGIAPFVDWTALATIAAVPMTLFAGGLLFKLGRMLLSHVPFFGGK